MHTTEKTISACLLVMFFLAGTVHSKEINCPSTIEETPAVSGVAGEWMVYASTGARPLAKVELYSGPPSDLATRIPETKKIGAKEVSRWRFSSERSEEFWIACTYSGTTAIVARKLDAGLKLCEASYDLLPSGRSQRLARVECR
jgi:hypothetical protein